MDCYLLFICTLAIFENKIKVNSVAVLNGSSEMNTTTLVCQNGVLISEFCLCQDGWSGTTCNISNVCPEQNPTNGQGFTFPKTFLGQFAFSRELCQPGTSNAGLPRASALCDINTRMFNLPNRLDCSLTLDDINQRVPGASVDDKIKLASSTQILTSNPEHLTPQNIINAVKIASILLSPDKMESPDIATSTVATVSQLLSTSHQKFSDVDYDDMSRLTQTLQKFSVHKNSNNMLVQPNLAVQSIKGTPESKQVQLTLFKGQNDKFLPDRIKLGLEQDVPGTLPSQEVNIDLQMNITFPKGFDKDVGFVLYDNDQFFPSKSFKSFLNTKRRVISANLAENDPLNGKFTVTVSNSSKVSLHKFACVFWDYEKKDWSTEGCTKTKSFSDCVCQCTSPHSKNLNFAILMTFNINYQYFKALHWISITGCSLSIVGLAVTAVYQFLTRKSRGCSPTLLLVNICLSMAIFYLLFIFGINNPVKHGVETAFSEENKVLVSDHHLYPDEGPCTIYTALIHYFLLATFTWNTLYGLNVFLLFRKTTISGTPPWFPKMSLAVGWGFPAVIVGITLGSTYKIAEPLGYRQEEFCWLAFLDHEKMFDIRKPMFWGFLLPLVIMLISNLAILLHFSHNICKTNPNLNSSQKTPLKKKIFSSFSLAVMLGVSWGTGYILLITHEKTLSLILSIVFCVCNTTQGIQIFILFTVRSLLNSKPAVLNAPVNAPDIGLHRKTFFLWKAKVPENRETYTSTNPDRLPEVINEP